MRIHRPIEAPTEVTPRESQVLDMLVRGYTPKAIGLELGLSVSTVKTHMRSLYRKMKVSTRTQLVLKTLGTTE